MAWITHPGLAGKVYIPEDKSATPKKHPCAGCFSCQWCDDNRCHVCRCGQPGTPDRGACRCNTEKREPPIR